MGPRGHRLSGGRVRPLAARPRAAGPPRRAGGVDARDPRRTDPGGARGRGRRAGARAPARGSRTPARPPRPVGRCAAIPAEHDARRTCGRVDEPRAPRWPVPEKSVTPVLLATPEKQGGAMSEAHGFGPVGESWDAEAEEPVRWGAEEAEADAAVARVVRGVARQAAALLALLASWAVDPARGSSAGAAGIAEER